MSTLRVVFMGTAEFAVPSLQKICAAGHSVQSVVTGLDEPRGRGQILSPTPVKVCAVELGLPVLQPSSLKEPAFAQAIRQLAPDIIVVVAFRILPPDVFEIPRLGSVNLHSSLLPKYRGAAPIQWAIINGETETGVTTFFIQQKVDTGNILLQRRLPIDPDEDAGSLHDRLAQIGAEVLVETVDRIASGSIQPARQNDSLATPAPKIFREHCHIDWTCGAPEIHNFIRGVSPHPCAWTSIDGQVYKIYRTELTTRHTDLAPGTIVTHGASLEIASGNGLFIRISEMQPPSRKRMTAAEFLRGYRLREGSVCE